MNVYHGIYTIRLSDDRWSSVPPARGALDLCLYRPLEHSGGRHGLSGVPASGLNLSGLTGRVWTGLRGDTLSFFLHRPGLKMAT